MGVVGATQTRLHRQWPERGTPKWQQREAASPRSARTSRPSSGRRARRRGGRRLATSCCAAATAAGTPPWRACTSASSCRRVQPASRGGFEYSAILSSPNRRGRTEARERASEGWGGGRPDLPWAPPCPGPHPALGPTLPGPTCTVCGAFLRQLSSLCISPASTSRISCRIAIIASQKRSSSYLHARAGVRVRACVRARACAACVRAHLDSDSVGSTMSVPPTGHDIVGAWKP